MRISSFAVLVGTCAAVGCAGKPPPPPVPALPPPDVAGVYSAADGAYRGTSTRVRAESHDCPSAGLVDLQVVDGVFSYRWDRDVVVLATIGSDASFEGESGDITLKGRVNGDRIEGDVKNPSCAYHFTATKLS
jgi:hypothetical protein